MRFTSIQRIALIIGVILILGSGAVAWRARNEAKPIQPAVYSLHIQNQLNKRPLTPMTDLALTFNIRTQSGQVFKDFDQQQPYPLAFIVIRKDRTNFQHIHPKYDASSGTFTVQDFKVSADGPYRLFAAFAPDDASMDNRGTKRIFAPYADITVGDMSRYVAAEPGTEKLTSAVGDYEMQLFSLSSALTKQPTTLFFAGASRAIGVALTKGAQPVANLEDYRGSLARMVAIGPNLELVSANAIPSDPAKPTDPISFRLTLPTPGDYRFFVQAKADENILTFDFEAPVHS